MTTDQTNVDRIEAIVQEAIEKTSIMAIFRDRGFDVVDRDHFCHTFVKMVSNGFLYVGKHLEEGGSDLPTRFSDPVYVEVNDDTGAMLTQRIVPTLTEDLAEGR